MGILKIYEISNLEVTNGYRCNYKYWRINKYNGNASMRNHTGHAIDFRILGTNVLRPNGKKLTLRTQKVKHCKEIRSDLEDFGFKQTHNHTIKNRPRIEPGQYTNNQGQVVNRTWVHADCTVYEKQEYVTSVEEALRPMAHLFSLPVRLGDDLIPTRASLNLYYRHVEKEFAGGYYPVGSNTLWHGGVHIRMKKSEKNEHSAYAWMFGRIVGARLPSDEDLAVGHYGSYNFILMEHMIGDKKFYSVYMHLAREALSPTSKFVKEVRWLNKIVKYKVISKTLSVRRMPSTEGNKPIGKLNQGDEIEVFADADPPLWKKVTALGVPDVYVYGGPQYLEPILEPDEDLLDKLDGGGVVKIDIPVQAGEKLWYIGEFGSGSHRTGLLHWEIFSGEFLFDRQQPPSDEAADRGGAEAADGNAPSEAADRKVLIREVTGPKRATAFDWISYKVSKFNVADPTSQEKQRVSWRIEAGDEQVDFPTHGDEINYQIPESAAGKKMVVMPYMNKPTPKVSVNTSVSTIVPVDWQLVEDPDKSDYNVDSKAIFDIFGPDLLGDDSILDIDELKKFYAGNEDKVAQLRNYACKFVSEWGIPDLEKAVDKMRGGWHVFGLKDRLEPYVWWKEAMDKGVELPGSPHVWHYNPIRLMEALVPVKRAAAPGKASILNIHQGEVEAFIRRNGIKPRHEWGTHEPFYSRLNTDWDYNSIAVHHSGNSGDDEPTLIEEKHMDEEGWWDVGYHFLIDPEGQIYEGRKLFFKGSHIGGANTGKIGILVMGDFEPHSLDSWRDAIDFFTDKPTQAQIASLVRIVNELKGFFSGIKMLGGHRDWGQSQCPGEKMYKLLDLVRSKTNLAAPTK